MMAQARSESQSSPGLSQSVLNGLRQCVIAITRSLQGPRQDELYFMALRRIFFFLFSSNLNAFFPLHYATWSEYGIVFLPLNCLTKQFICNISAGRDIFCLSQCRDTVYTYTFSCFLNDILRLVMYG